MILQFLPQAYSSPASDMVVPAFMCTQVWSPDLEQICLSEVTFLVFISRIPLMCPVPALLALASHLPIMLKPVSVSRTTVM